jgi:restriction system protein
LRQKSGHLLDWWQPSDYINERDMTMTASWLVRAGKNGERDTVCLESGVCGGGFAQVGDLTACHDREDIRGRVASAYSGSSQGKINNFTGQLYAFRSRIEIGDLVVLPLKTTREIAFGRVTGEYEFRNDPDPERRHLRPIKWTRNDISRAAINSDLLYSLGAFMTVCQITRNDAAFRLEEIEKSGKDPGARPNFELAKTVPSDEEFELDATQPVVDLSQYARDRLRSMITEQYMGHGMERLVAAILQARGFQCEVSPVGPDGSIDILAGRGPLGLDAPRIVVQSKSGDGKVDAPTVQQLDSVISTLGADQGLLVAWGGITPKARQVLASKRFTIRIWEADDLIDALTDTYSMLSESIRAEIPLKQVWIPVEDAG